MNHIKRVEIENIRGIEHLVIDAGMITVISGKNGSGKTSVIEAIRQVFAGGYDPLAVRQGAEYGRITLTADDGSKIIRTISPSQRTSRLKITSESGEAIKEPPQTYVDSLAGAFSYDPMLLLGAKPKDRYDYLKKTLRIDVSFDEVAAILDRLFVERDVALGAWNPQAAALDRLAAVRKAAYDRRTKVNGEHRDLEGSIRTMRAAVPSLNEDGRQWGAREAQAREALSAAQSEYSTAMQQVADESQAAEAAAIAEQESEIRRIRTEAEAAIEKAKRAAAERRQAIGEAATAARAEIQQRWVPEVTRLRDAHALARKSLSDYDKAVGARKAIEELEKKLEGTRTLGDKLSLVIKELDALEKAKLDASPLDYLRMRDGEIYIDGIPFDGANTQARYRAAIELGAMNAGPLRIMIVDDMEHWDTANFEGFKAAASAAGFQVFAGRVDDCDLEVNTE